MLKELNLNDENIIIFEKEWGHNEAEKGKLGPWFIKNKHRNGVSWGRCVLHYALWKETKHEKNPLIWILDDDIILEENNIKQLFNAVNKMKKENIKIGIGHIIGDPPLMPIYTIRTQLIDFYYRV